MAPIPMEICADSHKILDGGVYCFRLEGDNIAYYPIISIIIQEIIPNPDYVAPLEPVAPEPNDDFHALRRLIRGDI